MFILTKSLPVTGSVGIGHFLNSSRRSGSFLYLKSSQMFSNVFLSLPVVSIKRYLQNLSLSSPIGVSLLWITNIPISNSSLESFSRLSSSYNYNKKNSISIIRPSYHKVVYTLLTILVLDFYKYIIKIQFITVTDMITMQCRLQISNLYLMFYLNWYLTLSKI